MLSEFASLDLFSNGEVVDLMHTCPLCTKFTMKYTNYFGTKIWSCTNCFGVLLDCRRSEDVSNLRLLKAGGGEYCTS